METVGSLKDEFPDKYLFAEDLGGKKVTLTIGAMNADSLVTEGGKRRSIVVTFVGKKKLLVLNKTNAHLINEIFPLSAGQSLKTWVGKRITIYPTQTKLRGEVVDCIRVYGSPDLKADKKVLVKQGFSRVAMTLHAMGATDSEKESRPENNSTAENNQQQSRGPTPAPDPAIAEAWSALGWSNEQGWKDANGFTGDSYLDYLSGLIDRQNAEGLA